MDIEEFLINNLPDYETELTFEPHQIKIMMFEWGKSQAKRIEELEAILKVDKASLKGIRFIAERKEDEITKLKERIKELENNKYTLDDLHEIVNDSHCGVDRIKSPSSNNCAGFVINWTRNH